MRRRNTALLLPGEPLSCPLGHAFAKDYWAIGEEPGGGIRCKHRPPPGRGAECGKLVYWMLWPGGARLVVEVTSFELHEMESKHMSIKQVRDFLELTWERQRGAA